MYIKKSDMYFFLRWSCRSGVSTVILYRNNIVKTLSGIKNRLREGLDVWYTVTDQGECDFINFEPISYFQMNKYPFLGIGILYRNKSVNKIAKEPQN